MAGLVPAIPLRQAGSTAEYCVYILASRPGGAIYVGVTNDLLRRVYEHRSGLIDGFTKRYSIDRLVYFRGLRFNSRRDSTRAEHEALAKGVENTLDYEVE